ncbi:MAG: SDR family oxidoreductase [Candidatus Heimdallarchaeota archaeon]|nr:SDR family oxidoreductase [Candidatus Heimdallarchaeota archaeon]
MIVVITGSTQGIGFALAKEFLRYGDDIVISSRKIDRVNDVVKVLESEFPESKILGFKCDVTQPTDLENLAKSTVDALGVIDIWVNNAGTSGFEYQPLQDWDDGTLKQIIETNMLGTLYGSKEAIKVMTEQKHGKIFNLAGMGSNGMASPNLAAYGASKGSIPQLTKSLAGELKGTGVLVNHVSPGIVLTDMITTNVPPQAVSIFNILASRPENVAKFLVKKMRAVEKSKAKINYLNSFKAFWRFMTAGFRKGKYFDEEGNFKG